MCLQLQQVAWAWHSWHLCALLHGFVAVADHGGLIVTAPHWLIGLFFRSSVSRHQEHVSNQI